MKGQWRTRAEWVWILVVILCIIGPPLLALKQIQTEKSRGLAVEQSLPATPAKSNNGESALDLPNLLIGALVTAPVSVVVSVIAAIIFDNWTRPRLAVDIPEIPRAQGQNSQGERYEFFHVRVRNQPLIWRKRWRKPAWSCQATLEAVQDDGKATLLGPIAARWTSLPEPLMTIGSGQELVRTVDFARMLTDLRLDVHNHEDQILVVALKFEGQNDCFLFTNESYQYSQWSNPAWRLAGGRHRIRIALRYERGRETTDFWLENNGQSLNDVHLRPIA
jgi:hypothetical protein